ncbi:MAG: hypothetical protein AB7G68_16715 [Nitrospiraceae bacterium]
MELDSSRRGNDGERDRAAVEQAGLLIQQVHCRIMAKPTLPALHQEKLT